MKLTDSHPQLIAAAIAATGALFLGASILELPFMELKPPGAYYMMGLSIVFIVAGGYFLWKARRGHLEPDGVTVTDVRKQAIEKMESPELLSQIAREDPKREVREKALRRLEKIAP
jgi:hypothetical protein